MMSTRPNVEIVSATARLISSIRPTSATQSAALPPALTISSTAERPCFSVRVAIITRAPCDANTRAIPRPIPWPPPVTIATLSLSLPASMALSRLRRSDEPRLHEHRRKDPRGAGDEKRPTQQIDVHVDTLLDHARRKAWAHSEPEHLHRDRVDDHPAPPIEARHCAEQVRMGEVPGEVVDADGDQVQHRAELADEKVKGHGATDDTDGERQRA